MSYIFNNKIAYSDSPNLDAFGRLRTAAVQNLVDIKHVYDKNPLQISEVTAGTKTVASSGNILNSFVGGADQSIPTTLSFNDNQIRIGSNVNGSLDEMWVCITPLGSNANFRGSLNTRYYL
jgi:hypothetical protein